MYQKISLLLKEYVKTIPFDLAKTLETILNTENIEIRTNNGLYLKKATISYDKYLKEFGDLSTWKKLQNSSADGIIKNRISVNTPDYSYEFMINLDTGIMTIQANTYFYHYQIPKERIDGIVKVIMEGSKFMF